MDPAARHGQRAAAEGTVESGLSSTLDLHLLLTGRKLHHHSWGRREPQKHRDVRILNPTYRTPPEDTQSADTKENQEMQNPSFNEPSQAEADIFTLRAKNSQSKNVFGEWSWIYLSYQPLPGKGLWV